MEEKLLSHSSGHGLVNAVTVNTALHNAAFPSTEINPFTAAVQFFEPFDQP